MKRMSLLAGLLISATAVWAGSDLPKESRAALIKSLQDGSVEVRTAAADAIAMNPDEDAARALETALIASSDSKEQDALVQAIVAVKEKKAAKTLADAIGNPQFSWGKWAKVRAMETIGLLGDKKQIKWLTSFLAEDQDAALRAAAIHSLGQLGAPPKKEEKK